jgi:ribonuclease Z
MMPLPGRWLSCLAVRSGGHGVLFDCGEGTQIALKAINWGFRDIDALCISHLHADHISGLVGMLLMFANSGRGEPLLIYGPPGLSAVVAGQRLLARYLPYDVQVVELFPGEEFAVGELAARCAPADHRGPCLAFRLDLPRRPRFIPERAQALGLPVQTWRLLQAGEPVEWGGRTVQPEEVLGPSRRGLSVVYATDTRPVESIARLAAGAELLVCEATFGDPADQPRAVETGHMTFAEAGRLARDCGARRLVLTHFSPALQNPEAWRPEAARYFPDVVVGHDGLRLVLGFEG